MARRFQFTLQAALEQADRERNEAVRVLRERQDEAEAVRKRLAALERRRDERMAALERLRCTLPRTAAEIALIGSRDDAIREDIAARQAECAGVREELRLAERRVDLQREDLNSALAELKKFERLREKEMAEFEAQQRRREESARDESAILRHRPAAPDAPDAPW